MENFNFSIDISIMISAFFSIILFSYWWVKIGRARTSYIYVLFLFFGILLEKIFDVYFDYLFSISGKTDHAILCNFYQSNFYSLKSIVLLFFILFLFLHLLVRIISIERGSNLIRKKLIQQRKGKELIVIIEDDELIPETLYEYFKSAFPNYDVLIFTNGKDFLKYYKTDESVKVILTDLNLKGEIDGLELGKKIREKSKEVILIAMTGFYDRYKIDEVKKIGFDDYFIKPFELKDLGYSMESLIFKVNRWKKVKEKENKL